MKKVLLFILIFLGVLSCSKDRGAEEYLEIKTDKYEVSGVVTNIQCDIAASSDIKAVTYDSWITITYECKYFISLRIAENTSGKTRKGTVIVKVQSLSKSITIVQDPSSFSPPASLQNEYYENGVNYGAGIEIEERVGGITKKII